MSPPSRRRGRLAGWLALLLQAAPLASADGPFAPWGIKPEKRWLLEATAEQAWRSDDLAGYRWTRLDAFDPNASGGLEPGAAVRPLETMRTTLAARGSWQPIADLETSASLGFTPATRLAYRVDQPDPRLPFSKGYVEEPEWGVEMGAQVEGVVRRYGPLVVAPFAAASWLVEKNGAITAQGPSGDLSLPGPRPGGLSGWIDASAYLQSLRLTGGVVAGWELPPWSAPYVGVRADWTQTSLVRRTSINDANGLRTFVRENYDWKGHLPVGLILGTGALGNLYWPVSIEIHLFDEWAAAMSYEILF